MKPLIITVEDDITISELVGYNLENEGYEVIPFKSGKELFSHIKQIKEPVLFVLDIMLPDMNGVDICKKIRGIPEFTDVPVIMLTAMGNEKDKVRALDSGADDYITKPFGVREFIARVNANTRRFRKSASADTDIHNDPDSRAKDIISIGEITIDDDKHRVYRNNTEIDVTNREYELLKFMMINSGLAFSRDELLDRVWGYGYAGETRTVDVHIRQLRRKLEKDDSEPEYIQTVRGLGYRFSER